MSKIARITISLPADVLEAVERKREADGTTRSEFMLRAIEEYLRNERRRRDDEAYVRGYQEQPEDEEELTWAEAGLLHMSERLRDDRWDDSLGRNTANEAR